jgi:hypothetical protein
VLGYEDIAVHTERVNNLNALAKDARLVLVSSSAAANSRRDPRQICFPQISRKTPCDHWRKADDTTRIWNVRRNRIT